jgi:glycosyltransferase involved in cell wall biosynthesis
MPIKKKKVAIFVDGVFIPSVSGAANRFHYLTRALQQHTNTEMVVILCDRGWSEPDLIKRENFRTYMVHPRLFRNVAFLQKILEEEHVDILQFSTLELAIELGIQLSYKLNIPLIFEAHYEDFEFARAIGAPDDVLKNIKFLQGTFGRFFDKVIALSDEDLALGEALGVDKKEIITIPSGAEGSDFPTNCFDINSKKVIFFGNLYFAVNLDALKVIKNRLYPKSIREGFNYQVIGDIQQVEKEKLRDFCFDIIGRKDDLYKYFLGSTFALAPVISGSGMRIKILNYMCAGIPVITTTQGARGFPRKDLLIIEDNFDKYVDKMVTLANNERDLKRYSEEGRKFILENMSWEKIAEKASRVYDDALLSGPKPKQKASADVSIIKFDDPPWIKEVIDSGRFSRNLPFVNDTGFSRIN